MQDRQAEDFHYELETRLAERLRAAAPAERQALYGEVYDELYRQLTDKGLGHRVAQNAPGQTELLLTLLAPFLEGTRVFVEFGAGDGGLAERVAEHVPTVWAVDSSAEAAREADSGVRKRTPEVARLEIAPASVDLAFSCHLVEHLHPDDLPGHLSEVHRQLCPGGRYIVVTPNRLLGPHDVSRGRDPVPRGLHLAEYDHGQLARALRGAGFQKVQALIGIGTAPRTSGVLALTLLEGALATLPRRLRAGLLGRFGRQPHRPLEQVKLVATR